MRTKKATEENQNRLMGIEDLMRYAALGRNSARAFGEEAGAVIRVGTRVLYDRKAIDRFIDCQVSGGGSNG